MGWAPIWRRLYKSNKAGNSLHYLWRWREGFEPQRASCDGFRPFVDLKTGNQLMHLKHGKILTDGELPPVSELGVAAEALEAAFNGSYRRDKGRGRMWPPLGGIAP